MILEFPLLWIKTYIIDQGCPTGAQWFRILKNRTKREKNEKFISIAKIINLKTSGFRFLSRNLFAPLDVFLEVINCL